jgi:hypothetical protein
MDVRGGIISREYKPVRDALITRIRGKALIGYEFGNYGANNWSREPKNSFPERETSFPRTRDLVLPNEKPRSPERETSFSRTRNLVPRTRNLVPRTRNLVLRYQKPDPSVPETWFGGTRNLVRAGSNRTTATSSPRARNWKPDTRYQIRDTRYQDLLLVSGF